MELYFLLARNKINATIRLANEAATETPNPNPTCSRGFGVINHGMEVAIMLMAAIRIKVPSTPLEKYSALVWP